MSQVLAENPNPSAALVTADQLDLIKRTIAPDATPDELKLFLYDNQRQGVHPLDKLIHFTKRLGKYTPVTSIDFMRIRAAETNEYAGSDDAVFSDLSSVFPGAATVTVWRIVQGQRCAFTATARWAEYKPEGGPSGRGDVMWRKMPHTMLAKCAEALALRKGFPRQLAGLYAREEMDQAQTPEPAYVVEVPKATVNDLARDIKAFVKTHDPSAADMASEMEDAVKWAVASAPSEPYPHSIDPRAVPSVPNGGEIGTLPAGQVYITRIEKPFKDGAAKGFLSHSDQLAGDDKLAVYDDRLFALASELCQLREPCRVELTKSKKSGKQYVKGIYRILPERVPVEPVDEDIPF